MREIHNLKKGDFGLAYIDEDGRIMQIGLNTEQSKMLQLFLAALSMDQPLLKLKEDYELVLKSELVDKKECE